MRLPCGVVWYRAALCHAVAGYLVRCGVVRCGAVWCSAVRCSAVWCDLLSCVPASVKVIVHLYSLSPPLALRVTVLTPDGIEALELNPHPAVPPTDILPASLLEITTFGVVCFVGVCTGVCSVRIVSTKGLRASRGDVLPAASVKVIVHLYSLSATA